MVHSTKSGYRSASLPAQKFYAPSFLFTTLAARSPDRGGHDPPVLPGPPQQRRNAMRGVSRTACLRPQAVAPLPFPGTENDLRQMSGSLLRPRETRSNQDSDALRRTTHALFPPDPGHPPPDRWPAQNAVQELSRRCLTPPAKSRRVAVLQRLFSHPSSTSSR